MNESVLFTSIQFFFCASLKFTKKGFSIVIFFLVLFILSLFLNFNSPKKTLYFVINFMRQTYIEPNWYYQVLSVSIFTLKCIFNWNNYFSGKTKTLSPLTDRLKYFQRFFRGLVYHFSTLILLRLVVYDILNFQSTKSFSAKLSPWISSCIQRLP